jgi:hypothetical protein
VSGSDASSIGLGGNFEITALEGVPGTGTVFIGGGTDVDQQGLAGSVRRGTFAPGTPPTLSGITPIASGTVSAAVRALAYCATLGADSDVLLIAMGTSSQAGSPGGGVVRVTGATGGSPAATTVLLGGTPIVNDLRVHCASGTVYAGTGSNGGGPSGALYKSTDGGTTFTVVPVTGSGVPPSLNVQVVAVNPSNPDEVLIAGNSEGYVLRSTDGGTTWAVVNDPHAAGGRNFLSEGVGDLEIPPASSPLVAGRATVTSSKALVGTGGGLFAASVRGAACTTAASCDDHDACTDDACTGGSCVNTPKTGIAGALCEVGTLGQNDICGADPLDPKLAAFLDQKVTRVRALLQKANANSRKARKLLKGVDALLAKADKKVAKSVTKGKITPDCGSTIRALIADIRGLV